jgi:hypothetical protein
MPRPPVFAATLVALLLASQARAGFMYAFDRTSYTVAAGGTVDVRLYLQATGADIPVLTTDGLITSGLRVTFDAAGPARVLASLGVAGNVAFDAGPPSITVLAGSAGLTQAVDILSPAVTADGSAPTRILLGTFTFTAGSASGGRTATITATNFGYPPNSFNVTNSGLALDPGIANGTATIAVNGSGVSAVPAPSGLVLACAFAGTMLVSAVFRCRPKPDVGADVTGTDRRSVP